LELGFLLEAIKGAKDLATFAKSAAGERADAQRFRTIQEIVEALRLIYFSPRGVTALLSQLAEGRSPSEDQISMILPAFNDYEFRVVHMLGRLDPENPPLRGGLTLRAERVLREISYGKSTLREKVKGLLNEALTLGRPVSRDDAWNLLEEINSLNQAIEEAEEALILAAR
jgi:hypothetical protein